MSVTTNLAFPSQPTINSRFLDWLDAGRFPIHEFQSGGAFNRFGKALFFILSSWEIIRKKNILPRHTYHIFSKFEAPFAISAGDICYPISEGEVERLYPLIVRMEDRRFREHLGLDGRAFIRAIVRNACTLSLKQGGSTITQQLVRNTLISGERSFLRKAVEAILAVKIERHYSKEEIFRLYCECVYLGRGCRGFQAASKTIYRRPLQKLSDPELVSLIGLLRAPNFYHPLSDQKAFQRRANFVSGVVDKIPNGDGKKPSLRVRPIDIGHLKDSRLSKLVQMELRAMGTDHLDAIRAVHLTIDTGMQRKVDSVIQPYSRDSRVRAIGAIVVCNNTGDVLSESSWVQGNKSDFSFAVMGKIRPGSTFKTFGLIAALEQGLPLDLTLPSAPFISSIYYSDHLHSPWKVRNYAHRYHGRLDLVTALALSDNTVFARLSEMLSTTQLVSVYKRFGLVSDAESNPGIVLGGTRKGASILQLVTAYAAIARGGIAISPRLLRAVEYQDGSILTNTIYPRRTILIDSTVAHAIHRALLVSGTKVGNHRLPGKSGTSDKDQVFAGYTDKVSYAIWVGFRSPVEERDTKAPSARSIWEKVASVALGYPPVHLTIV